MTRDKEGQVQPIHCDPEVMETISISSPASPIESLLHPAALPLILSLPFPFGLLQKHVYSKSFPPLPPSWSYVSLCAFECCTEGTLLHLLFPLPISLPSPSPPSLSSFLLLLVSFSSSCSLYLMFLFYLSSFIIVFFSSFQFLFLLLLLLSIATDFLFTYCYLYLLLLFYHSSFIILLSLTPTNFSLSPSLPSYFLLLLVSFNPVALFIFSSFLFYFCFISVPSLPPPNVSSPFSSSSFLILCSSLVLLFVFALPLPSAPVYLSSFIIVPSYLSPFSSFSRFSFLSIATVFFFSS